MTCRLNYVIIIGGLKVGDDISSYTVFVCIYVSVLAKGVTKCWLCPRVDVERGASVIETSTRSFTIL